MNHGVDTSVLDESDREQTTSYRAPASGMLTNFRVASACVSGDWEGCDRVSDALSMSGEDWLLRAIVRAAVLRATPVPFAYYDAIGLEFVLPRRERRTRLTRRIR